LVADTPVPAAISATTKEPAAAMSSVILRFMRARAGRDVVIANSRGPESLTAVVSALGEGVSAGTAGEAATAGIVVIAVPWDRVPEAVQGLTWNGQVVLDATNDWAAGDLDGRTSSELVADLVAGAQLVKAGNTLSAEVLGLDPHEPAATV
jgi:8-hydroxy-5-deazaflavin:NADPH oxidoreductase